MAAMPKPIGYDTGVLADYLSAILSELRELNGKPPAQWRRILWRFYWRVDDGGD
jgi:hypothetical protein